MNKQQIQRLNYLRAKLEKQISEEVYKLVNDIVDMEIEIEQSCNQ